MPTLKIRDEQWAKMVTFLPLVYNLQTVQHVKDLGMSRN
jgi:hypothetical protein